MQPRAEASPHPRRHLRGPCRRRSVRSRLRCRRNNWLKRNLFTLSWRLRNRNSREDGSPPRWRRAACRRRNIRLYNAAQRPSDLAGELPKGVGQRVDGQWAVVIRGETLIQTPSQRQAALGVGKGPRLAGLGDGEEAARGFSRQQRGKAALIRTIGDFLSPVRIGASLRGTTCRRRGPSDRRWGR